MKICFVCEYFPKTESNDVKGGVEKASYMEAFNLSKRHDVTVLTSYEHDMEREFKLGDIKVIACGKPRPYKQNDSIINRYQFMKAAIKVGEKLDFDLVVGYNFITYISAYKISQKLKIPCAIRYHDVWVDQWIKNMGIMGIGGLVLEKYILSKDIDLVLPVSNYTAERLKDYYPEDKIKTVHNIVEFPSFEVEKYPKLTISCVSRLVDYKRIQDLIHAIYLLKEEGIDIDCKIVGTGPMYENLNNLVREYHLEDNIEFLGFVEKHEDVLKVIKSSHIFCLPSKVEGFGIVVVEALGCEVPFVASDIDPIKEATRMKGGLFFKREDSNDLKNNLKNLISDENLYNKLKKESLIQYSNYNGETISQKIEEEYLKLLKI